MTRRPTMREIRQRLEADADEADGVDGPVEITITHHAVDREGDHVGVTRRLEGTTTDGLEETVHAPEDPIPVAELEDAGDAVEDDDAETDTETGGASQ